MIYQKNDEKIFTKKNSRAIYNDFNIVGDNFYFDRNLNILNADGSVVFENKMKITKYTLMKWFIKNDGKIFTKKNSRAIYNDFNIVGDNFYFDRYLNILNADGSVVFENKNENYKIYSDEMIYQKNDEKIFTKKNSRAIYNDFNIVGDNFYFDRNLNILNADGNVKIDDKIENYTIKAEEITYKKN